VSTHINSFANAVVGGLMFTAGTSPAVTADVTSPATGSAIDLNAGANGTPGDYEVYAIVYVRAIHASCTGVFTFHESDAANGTYNLVTPGPSGSRTINVGSADVGKFLEVKVNASRRYLNHTLDLSGSTLSIEYAVIGFRERK
jgi:hypothetical protein